VGWGGGGVSSSRSEVQVASALEKLTRVIPLKKGARVSPSSNVTQPLPPPEDRSRRSRGQCGTRLIRETGAGPCRRTCPGLIIIGASAACLRPRNQTLGIRSRDQEFATVAMGLKSDGERPDLEPFDRSLLFVLYLFGENGRDAAFTVRGLVLRPFLLRSSDTRLSCLALVIPRTA
jgi:hypothetical protein